MKIVDCFIFYNELDMLKYRLSILNEYVDYFILVESTHTHVGKEKQLFYNENKELFKEFHSKIIHIIVDDFPFKFPNIDIAKSEQWKNENFQRNAIVRGLNQLSLLDDDIIIISDLDEIPDPKILNNIIENKLVINDVYKLEQDFYYYNLNSKMANTWYHSKIISYKKYIELIIQHNINDIRWHIPVHNIIRNAGWHLSYFGNSQFIQNKIQQFGHQEFNSEQYTNTDKIQERIDNCTDLYGRSGEQIIKISIKDNQYLPPQYETYLSQFILF
jgi:beta-1,4-mannosyl-glycoprotein beta-1,4-N-acetylglucosaminyltransferase